MSRRYFQFPLCALSFGSSAIERVNTIIGYCCVERGIRLWATLGPHCRQERRDATPPTWCTRRPRGDIQVQALLGCEHLNVTTNDLSFLVKEHSALCEFVRSFEFKYGRDAKVES